MTEFEELSDEEDAWLVAFYSGATMTTVTFHPVTQPVQCFPTTM